MRTESLIDVAKKRQAFTNSQLWELYVQLVEEGMLALVEIQYFQLLGVF